MGIEAAVLYAVCKFIYVKTALLPDLDSFRSLEDDLRAKKFTHIQLILSINNEMTQVNDTSG